MQKIANLQYNADARDKNYTFGEFGDSTKEEQVMALLAMSHTKNEQMIYEIMRAETGQAMTNVGAFSIRHLMNQSGLHNCGSIRRAITGLLEKKSLDRQKVAGDSKRSIVIYVVYNPLEIFTRREAAGLRIAPKQVLKECPGNFGSVLMTERLVEQYRLSRREAQVVLQCSEGLTNAEIGSRLFIQEETVKFHLRNIFIKIGVKRRTELMALLFRQNSAG